jgi:hypothetical protein
LGCPDVFYCESYSSTQAVASVIVSTSSFNILRDGNPMVKPLSDRIAEIKARKEKLAAQLNTLSAKAKTEARKNDTRRKIVVGAAMLTAIEKDEDLARVVRKVLTRFISRDRDRSVVADLLGPSPAPPGDASAVPTVAAQPAAGSLPPA